MSEYKNLSENAKKILEEGIIHITKKELEQELRELDSLRKEKFTEKTYYKYNPEDIYIATQMHLLMTNPEFANNQEKLIEETDNIFAMQLMRSVLIAISMEMESTGYDIEDYDNKVLRASNLLDGIPIAYYPNIIEFINEEEYSDCYYKGISFKKAYESNFCDVNKVPLNPDNYEKEKYYYRKSSLILLLRAIKRDIRENQLERIYRRSLQKRLYNF